MHRIRQWAKKNGHNPSSPPQHRNPRRLPRSAPLKADAGAVARAGTEPPWASGQPADAGGTRAPALVSRPRPTGLAGQRAAASLTSNTSKRSIRGSVPRCGLCLSGAVRLLLPPPALPLLPLLLPLLPTLGTVPRADVAALPPAEPWGCAAVTQRLSPRGLFIGQPQRTAYFIAVFPRTEGTVPLDFIPPLNV